MVRFTLPRDLYHGKGALEALKTLKGKKAIICVGGGSMKRFGFLQRAEDYLKEAGMEVKLFEGIESDPSVDTVMKGAKVMEEYQPDWIVAIGGGSPIDAAKMCIRDSIRSRLSWKRLFSVIVTDMNSVRINLYKRERIKDQSRYLRYEEAVGSTGQS